MTSYERSDAKPLRIVGAAALLLVVLGLVLVGVTRFESSYTSIPASVGRPVDLITGTSVGAPTPGTASTPRLEPESGANMAEYRAAAEQQLNSYGWVDRQAGTVHIPIDRAKAMLVQRGQP